jgi:cell division protease FtsH
MDDLHKLAKALLEYETLTGDEIVNVMNGIPPVRDKPEDKGSKGPSVAVPITGSEPELA